MMLLLGTLLQDVVLMMCNVVSIMKVVLSKTSEVTLQEGSCLEDLSCEAYQNSLCWVWWE
jgi:hypothetical protein